MRRERSCHFARLPQLASEFLRILISPYTLCQLKMTQQAQNPELTPGIIETEAPADAEQRRSAVDLSTRQALPRAEPHSQKQSLLLHNLNFDCRLLVWEYVFGTEYRGILRWRPVSNGRYVDFAFRYQRTIDVDFFPYRLRSPEHHWYENGKKPDNVLAPLLSCRQL